MIDVLLVDDQELMRRGLRLLLATVPDIEVVAEAADGAETLAMMRAALVRTSATGGDSLAGLTRAERLVAEQVALGRSNTEIAGSLVLAEGTVKNHVSSLHRSLGR